MNLSPEIKIPDFTVLGMAVPFLEFSFPGTGSKSLCRHHPEEPKALFSLLPAGDMGLDVRAGAAGRSLLGRSLPSRCITLNPSLVHGRDTIFFRSGNPEKDNHSFTQSATNCNDSEHSGDLAKGTGFRLGEADGILVQDARWAPCITVADCMPIWIWDRDQGWFGVLHSGWKGTGILSDTILSLCAQGSRSESIAVILGPSIGKCCYSVPESRAMAFESLFGRDSVYRDNGLYMIDLRSANLNLAKKSGVQDILSVPICTSCNPALGSYRREGPGRFTRMAALAYIPDPESG